MHELQLCGLVRREGNMIKIHRFIQDLSRRGDTSCFGVQKLLLYFDVQYQPWDDRVYEMFLVPDDCVPPWALKSESAALLWLHNLNGLSPETILRFLRKTGGPLDELLKFPNGRGMTQIGQFHLEAYSKIGLEPELTDIEHSWTVFQNAVQLKASLNPSSDEMGVILELLILFTVDKFANLVVEAMTLKSFEPALADLPRDVFSPLRQWLSEFDYSAAAHANLPFYLFEELFNNLVANFNLVR